MFFLGAIIFGPQFYKVSGQSTRERICCCNAFWKYCLYSNFVTVLVHSPKTTRFNSHTLKELALQCSEVVSTTRQHEPNPLTMMSIFLSGCMLTGMLLNTLTHVVIILLLKWKSKDPTDVNNYRPIVFARAVSKVLVQVLLVATREVPVECRLTIWFQSLRELPAFCVCT